MNLLDRVEENSLKAARRGSIIRGVLRAVGTGTVLATGFVIPNAISALAPLIAQKSRLPLSQAERALRHAFKRGWVYFRETDIGTEIALSSAGRIKWQKIELAQPLSSPRWDGRWRMVIFDIPNKHHLARDAFRQALKNLGFIQLQESVWITPHECSKELLALRQIYGIEPFVKLVETYWLEDEAKIKDKFNL